MEQEDFSFKRNALQIEQSPSKKKVHLDPFAQLEQALLNKEIEQVQNKQDSEDIPFRRIQIQRKISEDGECIHEEYMPTNYERKISWKKQVESGINVEFFCSSKLKRILTLDQSIMLECQKSLETTILLQEICLFWKNQGVKILYVCERKLCFERQRQLRVFKNIQLILDRESIKGSTQCLITDPETLRKLIFSRLEKLNQFNIAIFDFDSLNDPQIVGLWEQLLVTLPLPLNYFLLLHSTFKNKEALATWLSTVRFRPVHLLFQKELNNFRSFYVYPRQGQGLYMIKNKKGVIIEQNITKISSVMLEKALVKRKSYQLDLKQIIRTLYSGEIFPLIYYTSKKKDVESYARVLCQSFDFCSQVEKEKIQVIFTNSIMFLPEHLRDIKQVAFFLSFISKGIGILHEGMLPILSEVVQILSNQGLLKVVVTNIVRVDISARCVYIAELKRQIPGGFEFIKVQQIKQLSSVDKNVGDQIVVFQIADEIDRIKALQLIRSDNTEISSSLKLDLYSYLNYRGFIDMDAQYVMARSFRQFQNQRMLVQLKDQLSELQKERSLIEQIEVENKLTSLKAKRKQIEQKWRRMAFVPEKVIPFLSVGRIVKLRDKNIDWGYGVVVNFHKIQVNLNSKGEGPKYCVDAFVFISCDLIEGKIEPKPATLSLDSDLNEVTSLVVLTFNLQCVWQVTSIKISSMPNNCQEKNAQLLIFQTLKKAIALKPKPVEIECLKRQAFDLKQELKSIDLELAKFSSVESLYQKYQRKEQIEEKMKLIKLKIKDFSSIVNKKALKAYYKLLKHNGFIEKGALTNKGKAASCINSPFLFLIMKLLQQNFYESLMISEIAALTVIFVNHSKVKTDRYKAKLINIRQKLEIVLQAAKKTVETYKQHKIELDQVRIKQLQNQFTDDIKEQFVEATIKWCSGLPFYQICSSLQIYQGTFIDVMKKLSVLLEQLSKASFLLKKQNLSSIFLQTRNTVCRDVVQLPCLFI